MREPVKQYLRGGLCCAILHLVVFSASSEELRPPALLDVEAGLGPLQADYALGGHEKVMHWATAQLVGVGQPLQIGLQANHDAAELVPAVLGLTLARNNPSDDSAHGAAAQHGDDQSGKLWNTIWHGAAFGISAVLAAATGAFLVLAVIMGPCEIWETLAIRDWWHWYWRVRPNDRGQR